MIPSIGNTIFTILNAKKEQEQQKALTDILIAALSPTPGTPERPATAPALTPPPIIGGSGQPGEAPTFTQSELSQYPGIAGTEGFTPGIAAIPPQQKSALQMFQAMLNHPLYNNLQPGQAEKLIQTITGISKFLPEAPEAMNPLQLAQADYYKAQAEKARQPGGGFAPKGYSFHDGYILNEDTGVERKITGYEKDPGDPNQLLVWDEDGYGYFYNSKSTTPTLTPAVGEDGVQVKKKISNTATSGSIHKTKSGAQLALKEVLKGGGRGYIEPLSDGTFEVKTYAPPAPEGEKKPSWGQEQTISSVRSDLQKFRGTIYSPAGIPIPTEFGTYAAAMDYLSKVRLDPKLFKTELDIYKGIDRARASGMAIVIDTSGNVYSIKPNEVKAYVKAGYTEVPK